MRKPFHFTRAPASACVLALSLLSVPAAQAAKPHQRTPTDLIPGESGRLSQMERTISANSSVDGWNKAVRHAQILEFCRKYWSINPDLNYSPTKQEIDDFRKSEGDGRACSSKNLLIGSYDRDSEPPDSFRAPDFVAARRCAILHAASSEGIGTGRFDGYAMLAILYAEGAGVEQSWPTAAHFACLNGNWSSESSNYYPGVDFGVETTAPKTFPEDMRIWTGEEPILAIQNAMILHTAPKDYDGCDPVDGDGQDWIGACLKLRKERALAAVFATSFDRTQESDPATPVSRQSLFNDLLEKDVTTLAVMTITYSGIVENARVTRSEYNSLIGRMDDLYQAHSQTEMAAADVDLNRIYQQLKCGPECRPDPAMGEAVQDAQRAWLRYRGEMISEAVLRATPEQRDHVRASVLYQLTAERVAAFNRWIDMLQSQD